MEKYRLLTPSKDGKDKVLAGGNTKVELKALRDSRFSDIPTCIERGRDHPFGRSHHSGDKYKNSRDNIRARKFVVGQDVRVLGPKDVFHEGTLLEIRRGRVIVELSVLLDVALDDKWAKSMGVVDYEPVPGTDRASVTVKVPIGSVKLASA